ncbi:glycosyltransferase family 4 protein [Kordiimonas sp.]|uniref:glycosyltransferase family 4 protein n=1 Tax=Kordiimonas sp. TaxID=1970157 RepID=UPI003A8EACC6
MKVLLLSGNFHSQGGMIDYLKCWADQLARCGEDFYVISVSGQAEFLEYPQYTFLSKKRLSDLSMREIALSFISHSPIMKDYAEFIAAVTTGLNAREIHIIDDSVWAPFIANWLKKKLPKATELVVTVHDPKFHIGQHISLLGRFSSIVSRRFLLSLATEGQIRLHVHDRKLIPGTVFEKLPMSAFWIEDHPVRDPIVYRSLNFPNNPVRIGFVGRVEPYKGVDLFIDCLLRLEKLRDDIEYEAYVVGRGALPESVSQLRCCHVINDFLPEDQLHSVIANMDLVILPYIEGTQSGIASLCHTYHIPLIVSDVGALPNFVNKKNVGEVFAAGDVAGLTASVHAILLNPDKLKMWRRNYGV